MSSFRSNKFPTAEEAAVHRRHEEAMAKAARELREERETSQALRWDLERLKSEDKRGREREERLTLQVVQLRKTMRDLEEELNIANEVGRRARDTVKRDERDFEEMSQYIKQEQSDLKKALDGKRQAESERDIALRRAERAEEELEGLRNRRGRERQELEETIRRQMKRGDQDSHLSASKEAALLLQVQALLKEQEDMRKELAGSRNSQSVVVENQRAVVENHPRPDMKETSGQYVLAEGKSIPKGGLFSELFRGMFPWGEDGLVARQKYASSRTDSYRSIINGNNKIGSSALPSKTSLRLESRPLKNVLDELADGKQYNDPESLEELFWQVVGEARETRTTNSELMSVIKDLREELQREKDKRESRSLEAVEARKALSSRIDTVDTLQLKLDERDAAIHSLERELSYSRSHIQAMVDGRDEEFRKSFSIRSQAAASLEQHRSSLSALYSGRKSAGLAGREKRPDGLPTWR